MLALPEVDCVTDNLPPRSRHCRAASCAGFPAWRSICPVVLFDDVLDSYFARMMQSSVSVAAL